MGPLKGLRLRAIKLLKGTEKNGKEKYTPDEGGKSMIFFCKKGTEKIESVTRPAKK